MSLTWRLIPYQFLKLRIPLKLLHNFIATLWFDREYALILLKYRHYARHFNAFKGVGAGDQGGCMRSIYTEIHRLGFFTVNHSSN